VGLVNYARSVDAGIAPISITREGGVHAQLVSGNLAVLQLALRFDARYTYSFFGAGLHPLGDAGVRSYLFGGGFGGKVPLVKQLSAELDGAAYVVQPLDSWRKGAPCIASELRLVLRVELHKHFSLLGGFVFDAVVNRTPLGLYPGTTRGGNRTRFDAAELRLSPGAMAGLRF
jgi:hypothetical protein